MFQKTCLPKLHKIFQYVIVVLGKPIDIFSQYYYIQKRQNNKENYTNNALLKLIFLSFFKDRCLLSIRILNVSSYLSSCLTRLNHIESHAGNCFPFFRECLWHFTGISMKQKRELKVKQSKIVNILLYGILKIK
jgi:hypothetical protein